MVNDESNPNDLHISPLIIISARSSRRAQATLLNPNTSYRQIKPGKLVTLLSILFQGSKVFYNIKFILNTDLMETLSSTLSLRQALIIHLKSIVI